ncbi:unnamed protein product [Bursaphelenchus xylophilus]|uniref:(pine wood nematode) hypothetical protein n=1 Tax=Bursaphelenchus xylophilus TaxID=6326 RepID=A0A1I7SCE5_BURXY|nr:unnamed protein product [Bursaphelenchus xylophilus]CAG9094256.1 unnamed protein product [Bursaphelenchus xylophilus]
MEQSFAFRPAKILAVLVRDFGIDNSAQPLSRDEHKLAKVIYGMLDRCRAGDEYEVDEEDDMTTDPDYVPENDNCVAVDAIDQLETQISFPSGEIVSLDRAVEAINYYRDTQKNTRSLASMYKKFRFIKADSDLKKLRLVEKQRERAVSRRDQFRVLNQLVAKSVKEKIEEGIGIHDTDIMLMALKANDQVGIRGFIASQSWVTDFKRIHSIVSRHITTFVSKRSMVNREHTASKATALVEKIKSMVGTGRGKVPYSAILNTDQSALLKELPSNRSLAYRGEKTIQRIVQSVSSITHSITIMPTIYADGKVCPKLFIVMKEKDGKFPSTFRFRSDFLVVRAGHSHIMTKPLLLEYIENCIVHPGMPPKTIFLCDSWSSFKDHESMKSKMPPGKQLEVENIPPKATSLIQPLDVGFFRTFKAMERRVYSRVLLENLDFKFYQREIIVALPAKTESGEGRNPVPSAGAGIGVASSSRINTCPLEGFPVFLSSPPKVISGKAEKERKEGKSCDIGD